MEDGLKTVQFDKNSSLAKNVNNSQELKEQITQNIDKLRKSESLQVSFNQDTNLFRSLHNATNVNAKVEDGTLKGYLYDKYDFEYQKINKVDPIISIINNTATSLQNTGKIQNYHIIISIEIKLQKRKNSRTRFY